MKSNTDATGQTIWAHLKGRRSYEIIERDDGYFDISSGPKIYFLDYKDWPDYEKKALKFVKGRVLDVGCGAGRISLYLQKNNFDVIGIDISPLAIKVCKQRGLKKSLVMSISEVNKFKPNSFNTIIMFGNNFGLLGTPKRAKIILRKLRNITSSNALIIAESIDPYKTDDPDHLAYHKFNKNRGRMPGQLKIRIRYRKYVGSWIYYLFVSKCEMKNILKGTGWKINNFIGSPSNSSFIAIIRKVRNI